MTPSNRIYERTSEQSRRTLARRQGRERNSLEMFGEQLYNRRQGMRNAHSRSKKHPNTVGFVREIHTDNLFSVLIGKSQRVCGEAGANRTRTRSMIVQFWLPPDKDSAEPKIWVSAKRSQYGNTISCPFHTTFTELHPK
jgi:hypothetical protein